MKEPYIATHLEMRLLVGFLGERAQFGWWPTSFAEASSPLFLEPVFSTTSMVAQYHGLLEAARRVHDEHLSVGTYHLFRLPEEIEQDLHSLVVSSVGGEIANKVPRNKDDALNAIKQIGLSGPTASQGPIAIGNIKDIACSEVLRAIAGLYASAFARKVRAYPYLIG